MISNSVFSPGENCWKVAEASQMAVIIDCENFYRAIYEAFVRARKSIFIVGWDIDSRIRLLRNQDAEEASYPTLVRDLLKQKAEENPELQIYLVRWDSSVAFLSFREVWPEGVWQKYMPDNIQVVLDSTIPVGGSQHQKLIVVDDEVAFSGGMDIAVQRWDTRAHEPHAKQREDCTGSYPPYHDVQSVMAGPVVEHLAELVRWRWNRIASSPAIELGKAGDYTYLPPAWPPSVEPLMSRVSTAIARTIPEMQDTSLCEEVESMLLRLVKHARSFIYIENQFVSYLPLAKAINQCLRENPELQVIIVSSYKPKGLAEQESYWAGRIEFKKLLMRNVNPHQVRLAYSSVVDAQGEREYKLIHSKLMFIDDAYMVVGSANLNKRSMSMDTECDVIFEGETEQQKRAIAAARNDLLAEHCGESVDTVEEYFQQADPLSKLMQPSSEQCYQLLPEEDQKFTDGSWKAIVDPILDPDEPIIEGLNTPMGEQIPVRNPPHKWVLFSGLALILGVVVAVAVWGVQFLPEDYSRETLTQMLEHNSQNKLLAFCLVLVVFVFTGFLFVPVTVVTLAVAAVYGPWFGVLFSITGALASAVVMFFIGHLLGDAGLRNLGGPKVQAVNDKLANATVFGVAVLRMVPIAPYTLVNLVAGISSLRFSVFVIGSLIGVSPALIANSLVGDSLFQLFTNPSDQAVIYLVAGVLTWIALLLAAHKLSRRNKFRDS